MLVFGGDINYVKLSLNDIYTVYYILMKIFGYDYGYMTMVFLKY